MPASRRIARGLSLTEPDPNLAHLCAAFLGQSARDTFVVGLAAAQLHGLWLPREITTPEVAHCAPGRRSAEMLRSRRTQLVSHRWEVPPEDLTVLNGLPITSLERTWWDLAARLTLPDLIAAGDRALQLGASEAKLARIVQQRARRRGNARARMALPRLDARSRSRPESHLRIIVREAGLDCFEVNGALHDRFGGWLAEADLACPDSRIALEYQGAEHASVQRMRRDITRATELRHHDWLTLAYGPAQVFRRPWEIGPELRYLHARRMAS